MNTEAKTGSREIGIYFLEDIWRYHMQLKGCDGQDNAEEVDWKYVNGVFNALGLGLEPTIKYLMLESESYEDFKQWVFKHGRISPQIINQFNSIVDKRDHEEFTIKTEILSRFDLEQWNKDGYVILKEAISEEDCVETVNLIYETIEADPCDSMTWYKDHPLKQGIMVQLFDSPILDKNRFSQKIQLAYQQLWQRKDLMVSHDRVSFNPPETLTYQFQGPSLHWDMSLKRPIPFGLQGLLYLSDTAEDQGGFTVIPGFHNKIHDWLASLGDGVNPRDQRLLNRFKSVSIAGKAGDFIIWNQCLPHGSKPNRSSKPRIVQYINYQPLDLEYQKEWI